MNNDLISRSALKKAFEDTVCIEPMPYAFVKQIINNAPTVEPFEPDYVGAERLKARQRGYNEGYHKGMEIGKSLNPKIKHGKWIRTEHDKKGEHPETARWYKCSVCNVYNRVNLIFKYCPECGAQMDITGGNV